MAVYAAYHRHPLNRLTHFIGVPLIMFSLLLALSMAGVPVGGMYVSAAVVLVLVVLGYYFLLDVPLAVAMTLFCALMLAAAHWLAWSRPAEAVWAAFAACFIGGWILQLVGHLFEGRRPALADNAWQIFVAPIFLMAEAFFALGLRTHIRDRVRARLVEDRQAAAR